MKKLLPAVAMALALSTQPAAAETVFTFSQDGWSDGGLFIGQFTGEDLNNDGQISSFLGEVSSFSGTYTSSQFEIINFSSLDAAPFGGGNDVENGDLAATGLVFTLDGTGQLGDDTFGDIEGLGVFSDQFYLAVGPGPFNQCNGTEICGGLFNAFDVVGPPIVVSAIEEGPIDDIPPPPNDGFLPEERALATNTNAITVAGDLGNPDGLFEGTPVLPNDVNEEGGFVFNLDEIRNLPERIFFIDPEIAIGYTYEVVGDEFFAVQAPSFGAVPDDEYILTFNGQTFILASGELFFFDPNETVTEFTITGINPDLSLDPNDPFAFVTGVAVSLGGQGATITQTPITADIEAVPLPAGGLLLLSGLAGLALVRRRRTVHDA